jgi:glycosyltransferase involved in cell wall biosynthesis
VPVSALSVLHLSLSDLEGGAAKAAYMTHAAMRRAGTDSQMIVRNKVTKDVDVHIPGPIERWESRRRRLRARLPHGRTRLPEPTATFNFDVPQDFDLASVLRLEPGSVDVVLVHRITRFLTVREIAAVHEHYACPLVWVLHDQFPVTGGCHYSSPCEGFMQSCGRCPQLRSDDPKDRSREIWRRKERWLTGLPLTFVAPSKDALDWVRKSSLFREYPVEEIVQPIDADVYRPVGRAAPRTVLGLPREALVILVGAPDLKVPRKGGREALDALGRLEGVEAHLLVVGDYSADFLADAPFPGLALGRLGDDLALALAYQAADVFLSPSVADAGPMMVPEALLCGTPVVAFGIGCAPDLLLRPELGRVAPLGDTAALAEAVAESLRIPDTDEARTARRAAALHYESGRVGREYVALCERLKARDASGRAGAASEPPPEDAAATRPTRARP